MKNLLLVFACLLTAVPCPAAIIIVDDDWPYDFNNIQAAIDYSTNGDIIYVFPGTYTGPGNRDIDFLGKAITVQSVAPEFPDIVAATVIDCNGSEPDQHRVFYFHSGEDHNSVLNGLTITNGYVSGEVSAGGGILCRDSGPTITNCTIIGNSARYGGGMYHDNHQLERAPTIDNCTFIGNLAEIGGGMCYQHYRPDHYGAATIENCTFIGNSAELGGGMYYHYSSLDYYGTAAIDNCTFIGNSTERGGGGISCDTYFGNLMIIDSTISYNSAEFGGGGISCYAYGDVIIINSTISYNSAKLGGGGLCSWGGGAPTIINSTISHNTCNEGPGGAIYCAEGIKPMRINKCTISANKSFSDGGAVYFHPEGRGRATITKSIISGNSTGGSGGGIYCGGDFLKFFNCILTGNSAKVNGGGICTESLNYLTIYNCTFADNSAIADGGGIFSAYAPLTSITNSILWGNADSNGQGQSAQVFIEGQVDADVTFTCIQDDNPNDANIPFGADPNFNIDDDPRFVLHGYWDQNGTPADANDDFWVDGNYHLRRNSPCIEAGASDLLPPASSIAVDIDDQPRIIGLSVDMGADEFELPIIIVTKPQQGDIWANNSTHEIKWDSYAITGTVDISYSTNTGADWVTIENNTANTGSFTWHLPGTIDSNKCLVLVEPNTPDSNVVCIESGLFTIQPDFIHPDVPSKWKSLGGNFRRTGLSQDYGPEAGCIKWQFQTDARVPATATLGAGDRIHIACEDGKVYTLDTDGSLLWTYDTNSTLLSAPSVGPGGSIYVGSEDGKLYAISIAGRLRWTHTTDGPIYSSPAVSENGTIYVCSTAGVLYALAQDGTELWTFEADSFGSAVNTIFASPAIAADGTIYIGGLYDPNLYALDPNDGSVKWACSFVDPCRPRNSYGWPFTSPIVAPDGTIYQTLLYDANLYAIEPNAGTIIWSTALAKKCPTWHECCYYYWYERGWFEPFVGPNNVIYGFDYVDGWLEPVLGPDGTIYVTLDGDPYLRAVDPNGTIKWAIRLKGITGGFTLTIGSDGLIYAASDDGYLYVLDTDGGGVARFESDNPLSFPVIASDDTMIISDVNNTILAIGFDDCQGKTPALIKSVDLNADLAIDFIDFAIMADNWLKYISYDERPCGDYVDEFFLAGDINRDFVVNLTDLAALAYQWLTEN